MPPGIERAGWTWALAQAWAAESPAAAALAPQGTCSLDSSRGQDMLPQLASTILSEWIDKDFAAAQQWVAGLSDPALRDKLEITLLKKQAETDPAAAVTTAFQRKDVSGMEREITGDVEPALS